MIEIAITKEKPFQELAVCNNIDNTRTYMFSIDNKPGQWIDPYDDAITWNELLVYGVPAKSENDNEEPDDDFSSAIQIGRILGCHIPISLIIDLGAEPYDACDAANADLEAMYSVLQEYEDDFIDYLEDIYYIHEIELKPEYQGFEYEKILLLQLPAIIVKTLHVFPSLIMYFPSPTQHDNTGLDEETTGLIRHRLEYRFQGIDKKRNDDNIIMFPPRQDIPEKAINYVLGRRNPGEIIPEAHRNQDIYTLYKSVGFKEIGKTGWLCKPIASIYTEDGLNH